jgi:transposase-like protein
MPKIRKEHNDAFRARVALEAIRGEKTGAEIAREFSVHPLQVSKWKKILLERAAELFIKGDDLREQEHAELVDRLYREIGELKVQLDWLKKKVGNFD